MMGIDGTGSGPYNVGSGKDRPIKDLFDVIVDAMGVELEEEVEVRPRPADDAPTLLLDPSKTKEDFGWEQNIQLEEGIPEDNRVVPRARRGRDLHPPQGRRAQGQVGP